MEVGGRQFLRRVDWRVIAGSRYFSRTVVHADRGLKEAVEMISGEVVELPGAAGCELAALTDPDLWSLRRACDALLPGAVCYCEFSSLRPAAVARAQRVMTAGGFSSVRCYWPWPPPDRAAPLFWLPMDATQAVSYFLDTRPSTTEGAEWAAAQAKRLLFRIAARGQLLAPICAIGWKSHSGTRSGCCVPAAVPVLSSLPDSLRNGWSRWGLGPAPSRLDCVMLTGGVRDINKVVLLVFAEDAQRPALVVKVARTPEREPSLAHEAAVMRSLPGRASNAGVSVPSLLFHEHLGGFLAIGEQMVEGVTLDRTLTERRLREVAPKVTAFLAGLARSSVPTARERWWDRLVGSTIGRFEAIFEAQVDRRKLEVAEEMLLRLPDLPLVLEYRDCSPENLVIDRHGGVMALDWEHAEPQGLPLLDLLYFLGRAAVVLDRTMGSGRERTSYARLLDTRTTIGSVASLCVRQYLEGTGLDPAAVRPLRILAWMYYAAREHDLAVADLGGRGTSSGVMALPGGRTAAAMETFLAFWAHDLEGSSAWTRSSSGGRSSALLGSLDRRDRLLSGKWRRCRRH